MENNDHPDEEQEQRYDMSSSLGYGQGMEYQYLNPTQHTQPMQLKLPPREKHFLQLGLDRQKRKQSGATPPVGEISPIKSVAPRRTSIGRAALIITGSMVASRILGLLRSSLFISTLGATEITDAYNRAFVIPNLVFTVVAGGALFAPAEW